LQDAYDILTGKTTVAKVMHLVESEGRLKADRLKNPLLIRDKFPGNMIPNSIMNVAEPVFFNFREGIKNQKQIQISGKNDYSTRLLALLKDLAPEKVTNILEFIWAMYLFFWIIIISKLLKIEGRLIVNKPKLTHEESRLKELVH
jgi:hypothetical protein